MFFIVKYLELRNKSYICNNDSVANDYRFVAEGGVSNHSSDFFVWDSLAPPPGCPLIVRRGGVS